MMKAALATVALLSGIASASAQYGTRQQHNSGFGSSYGSGTGSNPQSHTIQPYTNSFGTTTPPSHATNPNNTQMDNYSTRGNVNPYTGQPGTRTPKY